MKVQVEKNHYFKEKYLSLERFISYYYQIDSIRSTIKQGKILFVGPGDKLVSNYISNLPNYEVDTFDIDQNVEPDIIGDLLTIDLPKNSYDLAVAFEVLEHIPFENFIEILNKLSKISKGNIIISIPHKVSYFEFVFKAPLMRTFLKRKYLNFSLDIPLKFHGFEESGQHYWEIDNKDFSLKKVKKEIEKNFKIIKTFKPLLNRYHTFFCLVSKDIL